MGTILIAGGIAVLMALAIRKIYKDSKGGGCSGCSGCSGEHHHTNEPHNCQHGSNIN